MFRKPMQSRTIALMTLLALVGLTTWPAAEAQFGGGGIGGGGGRFGGGGEFGGGGFGMQLMMFEPSQSGKSLYAYSETTGEWDKLAAEPHPEHGLTPIASTMVAAVAGKTHVHAFSTDSGKWESVDVGEPVDVNHITVHFSRVVYRTDTHVHVFSNASGKWASVDLTKD